MMKLAKIIVVVLLFGSMFVGCKDTHRFVSERDTLSYIVGMNVGHTLMQMDSTLNVDVVCTAIKDAFTGHEKMSFEEMPQLLAAIDVPFGEGKIVAEVAQHIGDNVVRCIAMASTDGLQRGVEVNINAEIILEVSLGPTEPPTTLPPETTVPEPTPTVETQPVVTEGDAG